MGRDAWRGLLLATLAGALVWAALILVATHADAMHRAGEPRDLCRFEDGSYGLCYTGIELGWHLGASD